MDIEDPAQATSSIIIGDTAVALRGIAEHSV
jgi:hypothetical protein